MIEETATVVSLSNTQAELIVEKRSTCGQCQAKSGCGTAIFSETLGKKSSQITVENTLNLQVGDKVLVGLQENAFLTGSLMVYFLPIVMMIIFAIFGQWLADENEGVVIAFSVLGFILALALVRSYSVKIKNNVRFQPVVLRKLF